MLDNIIDDFDKKVSLEDRIILNRLAEFIVHFDHTMPDTRLPFWCNIQILVSLLLAQEIFRWFLRQLCGS